MNESPRRAGDRFGTLDPAAMRRLLDRVRYRGRHVALETEAMAVLQAAGLSVPYYIELPDAAAATGLADPPLAQGDQVVLKALGPDLLHKTDVGGVRVLPNRRDAVVSEARALERHLADRGLVRLALFEYVPHDLDLAGEFLLGLRWTRDYGPIVTLGPGGVHAEFLARAFREGEGFAVITPALARKAAVTDMLSRVAGVRLATRGQRGRAPRVPLSALTDAVERFLAIAETLCPDPIAELEINPLVASRGRLVALDALLTLTTRRQPAAPPRPLDKIARLLEPRSVAVAGVSREMNPGRIILQNLLREGFDVSRITVIKPGAETIDGVRCVPSLEQLPEPVDALVLAVAAPQAAEMLATCADLQKAESVVVIAGGLEEKSGTEAMVARMRESLNRARATPGRGPVVNGGNCLGVRSQPGRFNTLFIPEPKLPFPTVAPSPLALVSGSGAFAVSKVSKLAGVNPLYVITIGNQMDLTASDYLEHLAQDRRIEVFAVYLEGFQPLDGGRFMEIAAEIVRGGRTVILGRGGRTEAGAAAAASHTAAVTGDDAILRRLAADAGVVLAESLEDFEDLTRLFTMLGQREPAGPRLGAISNAGYESVAMADNLGRLQFAGWHGETVARLCATLAHARLDTVVTVRNPLDVTPMLGDADFAAMVRHILADEGVDLGVVGCVPLTAALDTLPAGAEHRENLFRPEAFGPRLLEVWHEIDKPWVAVVDGGRVYDPLTRLLDEGGVPTFRTADRALRLFGIWCESRLRAARRTGRHARASAMAGV